MKPPSRLLLVAAVSSACTPQAGGPPTHVALPTPAAPPPEAPAPAPPPPAASPEPRPAAAAFWSEPTRSPRLAPPADPRDAPLHAICGDNDRALHRAAEIELERAVAIEQLLPSEELNFTLR